MKKLLLAFLILTGMALAETPAAAQVIGSDYISAASSDCSTAGSCTTFDVPTVPSVAFTISGTFSATLTFEGTTDGVTWNAVQVINTSTGANGTVGSAASFAVQNSGYLKLRVRASAYVSGLARVVATRGWASARLLTPTFVTVTATNFLAGDGTAVAPSYSFTTDPLLGLFKAGWNIAESGSVVSTSITPNGTNMLFQAGGGSYPFYLTATGAAMGSGVTFGWASTATAYGAAIDTALSRIAANTLGLKNGSNSQDFRVYGDASNYFHINQINGAATLQSVAGGGTISLQATTTIGFAPGDSTSWLFSTAGHFIAQTDNVKDIGASGATRPRTGYFGTSVVSAGTTYAAGITFASGTASIVSTNGYVADVGGGASFQVRDQGNSKSLSITPASAVTPSASASAGGTVNVNSDLTRSRYQVTIAPASGDCSTAFIAAALTADCTIATLPAGMKLVGVYADVTAGFTCSGTCSGTKVMQAGTAAGGTQILAASLNVAATGTFGLADADLGSGMTRAAAIQGGLIGSWSSTTPVSVRFTSGTGNWGSGAATFVNAGSVKITLITEQVK